MIPARHAEDPAPIPSGRGIEEAEPTRRGVLCAQSGAPLPVAAQPTQALHPMARRCRARTDRFNSIGAVVVDFSPAIV